MISTVQACGSQSHFHYRFHHNVVISSVAIPPTNVEAADVADRFRLRCRNPEKGKRQKLLMLLLCTRGSEYEKSPLLPISGKRSRDGMMSSACRNREPDGSCYSMVIAFHNSLLGPSNLSPFSTARGSATFSAPRTRKKRFRDK